MKNECDNNPAATLSVAEPEVAYSAARAEYPYAAPPLSKEEIEQALAMEDAVISEEELQGFMTLEEFDHHLTQVITDFYKNKK